jgi:Zinc finger, C3HC4 type (RING finger)
LLLLFCYSLKEIDKGLQEKLQKLESNEKQLQAQLHQSKLIQLQQQKKLQQLCQTPQPPPDTSPKQKPKIEEIKESKEELLCPICLEKQKNVALDVCGHTLCKGCASLIIASAHKRCPICRKSVKAAHSFYL